MEEHVLINSGILQPGKPGMIDRIPEYDPRSAEHYWIALMTYHVPDPGADQLHFDMDALVYGPAICCYHCEEAYERRLLHRRCPGEPREAR